MEKVEIDNTIIKLLLEWKKPSVWIDYDKEGDVLYIAFEKPQKADDGKIYHYKSRSEKGICGSWSLTFINRITSSQTRSKDEKIIGITVPNASKINLQNKAA